MQKNQSTAKNSIKKSLRRSRKHPAIVVLQVLTVLILMGIFLVGGAVTGYVASLVKDEPVRSYDEMHQKIFSNYLTGFAYFNDGTMIGQLRAEEDRRLVKKPEVSPFLINAIIATEDKYFYEHHGVVFQSTLRGAYQEFTNQAVVTGGSTLTQQLVKNTILSREVSHERKAKEIFNALRVERMFSKDQILEAYMNEIYFGKSVNGSNIYGVQAASKGIFDKDVKDLNLAEATYMAGMPQSPIAYSPFTKDGYRRGKERQKMVLARMLENNYITKEQYAQAADANLEVALAKPARRAYAEHPYLMMEIEERAAKTLLDQQLVTEGRDKQQIGRNEYRHMIEDKRREILRNGYHIHTTVHKDINRIMQQIASNPENFGKNMSYTIRRSNGKRERIENALEEVGGMLIQNKTGAILGMIGGRDFTVEQTNHATVPRQPGSAMKPLAAYAPAFELGYLQPGMPIDDSPVLLADGQRGSHLPLNWDNNYHGMMSAREALRMSWNVPAIKTYLKVGIPTALEYVKKMGITTLVDEDNHAATGVIGGLSYGLTTEEITNAYATFANQGSFVDAYLIDRIEDSNGKVVYEHQVKPVPVFSPQTAYLVTDIMRTVVNEGTGTTVRKYIPRTVDIAGKTGTTNNSFDLWFVGYTPSLSLGIWSGYDEPHELPRSAQTRAMQIWGKVMREVVAFDKKLSPASATFEKPPGVTSMTLDSKSGLLPGELSKATGHLITDLINTQFTPTKVDDTHKKVRVVSLNGIRYLAKESTPDDFVDEAIFFKSPEPLMVTSAQIAEKNKRAASLPNDWNQRLPESEDPRKAVEGTPSVPGNVKVNISQGKITLGWTKSSEGDVIGYRIYRADTFTDFNKMATVKDPATTQFVETVTSSDNYGYYVTAVDITGNESSPSPIASVGNKAYVPKEDKDDSTEQGEDDINNVPPDGSQTGDIPSSDGSSNGQTPTPEASVPTAPKGLVASKASGGVQLTWKANGAREQVIAYNIYYTPDPTTSYQLLDTVAQAGYVHANPQSVGSYYITAVNSYGESGYSNTVQAGQ